MKIPYQRIPAIHGMVVLAFVALCAVIFSFLWTQAGGKIPLVTQEGYRVSVTLPDVDNLVFQSDVRIAGVAVGKIEELRVNGRHATATMELNEDVAPLHEGAKVTVTAKTLIEETYLAVVDGTGSEIPNGAKLPAGSGTQSVQLNDVLTSLDRPTRQQLRSMVRSSALVTDGTQEEVDNLLTGLGSLGREGSGALEAAADQSQDLAELTRNLAVVMRSLDQRQGQIVQLAEDSDAITASMAAEKENIEELMRALPPFMDSARDASEDLERLTEPLDDVAQNLDEGAPDLAAALKELPDTTKELKLLVPDLQRVVDRAPATFTRTPKFVDQTQPVVKSLSGLLQDVNPMLTYMKPYGPDMAAQFRNISLAVNATDSRGHILRVRTVFTGHSVNSPVKAILPGMYFNPYPAPGAAQDNPGVSFTGQYPRILRDPLPK